MHASLWVLFAAPVARLYFLFQFIPAAFRTAKHHEAPAPHTCNDAMIFTGKRHMATPKYPSSPSSASVLNSRCTNGRFNETLS
ncbi:hypothetical protein OF83DRAFT_466319 [Amylostereum chailletii]|nr:hypothetical protein OF83DRAFT_466319 [Amylostereum chailletii]